MNKLYLFTCLLGYLFNISYFPGWVGGLVGVWLRFLLILRLSQPSLAGVGAGAELGNISTITKFKLLDFHTTA